MWENQLRNVPTIFILTYKSNPYISESTQPHGYELAASCTILQPSVMYRCTVWHSRQVGGEMGQSTLGCQAVKTWGWLLARNQYHFQTNPDPWDRVLLPKDFKQRLRGCQEKIDLDISWRKWARPRDWANIGERQRMPRKEKGWRNSMRLLKTWDRNFPTKSYW